MCYLANSARRPRVYFRCGHATLSAVHTNGTFSATVRPCPSVHSRLTRMRAAVVHFKSGLFKFSSSSSSTLVFMLTRPTTVNTLQMACRPDPSDYLECVCALSVGRVAARQWTVSGPWCPRWVYFQVMFSAHINGATLDRCRINKREHVFYYRVKLAY